MTYLWQLDPLTRDKQDFFTGKHEQAKHQSNASVLARLVLQCVLGTEDGKLNVFYDPLKKDYLFAEYWVDLWYEEDHPLPQPESRQVCNRGKNLDEISVGFKNLYNKQI